MVMTIGTLVFYVCAILILLVFTYVAIKLKDIEPALIVWAVVSWAIVVVLPILIHFSIIEWINNVMNTKVW